MFTCVPAQYACGAIMILYFLYARVRYVKAYNIYLREIRLINSPLLLLPKRMLHRRASPDSPPPPPPPPACVRCRRHAIWSRRQTGLCCCVCYVVLVLLGLQWYLHGWLLHFTGMTRGDEMEERIPLETQGKVCYCIRR